MEHCDVQHGSIATRMPARSLLRWVPAPGTYLRNLHALGQRDGLHRLAGIAARR